MHEDLSRSWDPASAPELVPGAPAIEPAEVDEIPGPTTRRQLIEFLVILIIGILFTRTFMAEAYIVPTGSMAPTLLGMHESFTCPNCGHRFALGLDISGATGQPVCPNCGMDQWRDQPGVIGSGDRLLVQKYLFELRPPHRWEAVVFQNPAEPEQAYVKRVVGLPGESVLIRDGDIYINGEIARKDPATLRALRLLVYDNDHLPADHVRYPRWRFQRAGPRFSRPPSSWQLDGGRLFREPDPLNEWRTDWATYRHWQADRGGYGSVRDFISYNGLELPGQNKIHDLIVEADLAVDAEVEAFLVRIGPGSDPFQITIPVDHRGVVQVLRNGRPLAVLETGVALASRAPGETRPTRLHVALVDNRLTVELNDELLFLPLDFTAVAALPDNHDSPFSFGIQGPGGAEIQGIRLYRDIYYTDASTALKRPFGVGEPYQLGPDEYFVLGDNSPVSNDSRFWEKSPVVRRELLLGKPFLVHLPSQAVPLQVFGHELYWIPDPREIRYIH